MKKLCTLFLIVLSYSLNSQSLSIFSLDTAKFPTMRAKFYAFDNADLQIINLSPDDFEITENMVERKVTYISCPTPKPPSAISAVLTIDNSGSMTGNGILMAKAAATAWVKALSLNKSECAITSFNTTNTLHQDFTNDKQKLLDAINVIGAGGGTDFDAGLINPMSGGLLIAEKGKNKKVLVFLTDGQANGNETEIIKKANDIGCVVFCVTLGLRCPPILKNIAEQTGGQWFENITTEDEAKEIYMQILSISQNFEPCTIEWQSGDDCNVFRDVFLMLRINNTGATANYVAPASELATLEYSPSASMKFGVVNKPFSETKEITITAKNRGVIINSVKLTNPEEFEIVDWGGYPPPPFTIIKDRSRTFKIKYKPQKAGYSFSFCRFELETSACTGQTFFATGGILDNDVQTGELALTFPNGGETFVAGSDTIVTWTGILPEDTVSLDYSLDNGKKWTNVSDSASNFIYNWQGLPKTASKQCLMRVRKGSSFSYKKGDLISMLGLGQVEKVEYSPNSNRVVVAHKNMLLLVDLQLRKILHTFLGHKFTVLSVAFSPYGETIVSSSSDGAIKLWDVNTGKELKSFDSVSSYTNVVAFSPDGTTIAAACGDYTIKLLDAYSGNIKGVLTGHKGNVFSLAFHPDGSQIVSGSFDKSIKLWDIASSTVSQTFTGHAGWVNSVAFSPDGSRIASASSDCSVRLWHAKTGNTVYSFTKQYYAFMSVVFSPDGKRLYGGNSDGTVMMWDVRYGTDLGVFSLGKKGLMSLALSADGSNIAVGSSGAVTILDAIYGIELASFLGHTNSINSVAVSPDNSLIASTGDDGKILIWNLKTGWIVNSISGISTWMQKALFSKDGKSIFSCSNSDSLIRIWDVKTGDEIKTLRGHIGGIRSIALSPNGDKLVSAGIDFTIKVWDVKTGTVIKDIPVWQSYVTSLDLHPEGNKAVLGKNDKRIKVLDLSTGEEILDLSGHKDRVNCVAYDASGTWIASASDDNTIKIWDAKSGKELKSLNEHINPVKSLAFNHTGDKLVSGDDNSNIIVWDMITEQASMSFTGSFGSINSILFDRDSKKIVGAAASTVCIWAIMDLKDNNFQEDISDTLWEIVAPKISANDIDMGVVATGSQKDSLVSGFVRNTGTWKLRVDSIYIEGKDSSAFAIAGGSGNYDLDVGTTHEAVFRFSPQEAREYQADIVIVTQSDTLIQKIQGRGVESIIKIITGLVDFGKVYINYFKDTTVTAVIENISQNIVEITDVENAGPDKKQFSILKGGGSFSLNPGETHEMELRFTAKELGRTSGSLAFHHANTGSPAVVQLFAEAYKIIPNITSNSPICIGHDLYLYTDSIPNAKYHWSGPNGFESEEQNIIIRKAGIEHSGMYSVYATLGEISSDTSYIIVEINLDKVSPGDSSMIFSGSTERVDGYIKLTDSKPWDAGSAWLKNRFSVKRDFTTTFEFNYKYGDNRQEPEKSAPGADGFAFVMQNNNYPSLGNKGEAMGYNGITNSLAIEFDFFRNIYDPNGNHIAVQSLGKSPNTPDHRIFRGVLGLNKDIMEIRQDVMYYVKIDYKYSTEEMNIYLDTTQLFGEPVLTVSGLDLSDKLVLEEDEYVYIGFTAATGQACQEHRIYNWVVPCDNQYVGVDDGSQKTEVRRQKVILNIYPNPASDLLNIGYSLASPGNVSIEVFDVLGNKIESFDYGYVDIGHHDVILSLSKDEQNVLSYFPNGMYYLVLRNNEKTVYGKFGVMK
ncbi:MAG: choice-of-anchor D domain-containing protein [bacterium]